MELALEECASLAALSAERKAAPDAPNYARRARDILARVAARKGG